MNRLQFLAEMKKSLITTTKHLTIPFLKEEIEKIDSIRDEIVGVKWIKIEGITTASLFGVQEHFINNTPILIYSNGGNVVAYEKLCSNCQALVQWISYEKKLKCFTCDKTYHIELKTGDLTCKHHYIKEENSEWFIGMG